MRQKVLVVLLTLALVLVLAPLGLADNDTLIIGSGAEAPGLDPRVEVDIPAFERINLILEPLIVFNTQMELEARLAVDWELTNDNYTITFWLREGVTWHDGEPFTAEDVKYTFEWVLDPDSDAANASLYADIEEIEIEDDHTVHFHLSSPNVFLLNNMARMNITPAHAGNREDFRQNPVGTGPYMLDNWVRDDRMELVAFNDYWGGEPNIPNVVFRTIPENPTRLLAFEAGEIDVYQGGVVPREIERLEADPNLIVQRTPSTGYAYLGMNTLSEPLNDVRVRHALSHAINREGIVQRVLNGIGTTGVGPVPAALPWYNDDVPRYDYDIERARELLDEAGLLGQDITLDLYTNENLERIRIAEILQFEAARVGIDINVHIEEWGAFLDRILGSEDYDLYILGWSGQLDPDRAMYRQFHTEGSFNDTYISDPRLDELLEKGLTVPPDSQESIEIYREAQEIVVELAPYGFINFQEEVGLVHPYIEGYEVHPYPANSWQNAHLFTKNK